VHCVPVLLNIFDPVYPVVTNTIFAPSDATVTVVPPELGKEGAGIDDQSRPLLERQSRGPESERPDARKPPGTVVMQCTAAGCWSSMTSRCQRTPSVDVQIVGTSRPSSVVIPPATYPCSRLQAMPDTCCRPGPSIPVAAGSTFVHTPF